MRIVLYEEELDSAVYEYLAKRNLPTEGVIN